MTEQAIENDIQAKGKTAARVTPDHIDSKIVSVSYFTAKDGVDGALAKGTLHQKAEYREGVYLNAPFELLTFCVIILRNGFTVTGESACASPENFDAEIGRKIAYDNARNKIWPLEGYLLKERLSTQ